MFGGLRVSWFRVWGLEVYLEGPRDLVRKGKADANDIVQGLGLRASGTWWWVNEGIPGFITWFTGVTSTLTKFP